MILGGQVGRIRLRQPASAPRLSAADGAGALGTPTLVVAKRWLVRAACSPERASASPDLRTLLARGMPGAGAPALRIGRPRSPGSGGPSCGADFGRPV